MKARYTRPRRFDVASARREVVEGEPCVFVRSSKYLCDVLQLVRRKDTVVQLGVVECDLDACEGCNEALARTLDACDNLRELYLNQSWPLEAGVFEKLAVDTQLRVLSLSDTGLGGDEEVVRALHEAVKVHPTLERLDVSRNPLRDGALLLLEALKVNPALARVSLRSTYMPKTAGLLLAEVLEQNHTLQQLDISANRLSLESLEAVMQAMEGNSTLRRLDMRSCALSPEAVPSLVSMLRRNTALTSLDLSVAEIGPLDKLLPGLRASRSLHTLSLAMSGISAADAGPLAEYISTSPALRHLDLSDNPLGSAGGAAALRAAAQCTSLSSLVLARTQLSDVGSELFDLLARNHICELDLTSNLGLTNPDLEALFTGVLETHTLHTLMLAGINMSRTAIGALLAVFDSGGSSIRVLDLTGNVEFDNHALLYLTNRLKWTCRVQELLLAKTSITSAGVCQLVSAIPTSNLTRVDLGDTFERCKAAAQLYTALRAPRQGEYEACSTLLVGLTRTTSSTALTRFFQDDLFALDLVPCLFELLTGRRHRVDRSWRASIIRAPDPFQRS